MFLRDAGNSHVTSACDEDERKSWSSEKEAIDVVGENSKRHAADGWVESVEVRRQGSVSDRDHPGAGKHRFDQSVAEQAHVEEGTLHTEEPVEGHDGQRQERLPAGDGGQNVATQTQVLMLVKSFLGKPHVPEGHDQHGNADDAVSHSEAEDVEIGLVVHLGDGHDGCDG